AVDQLKQARDEVVKKQLTVRATEALVKRLKSGGGSGRPAKKADLELADLAERLKRHFKARVEIRQGSRGGKLEISYAGRDELTRIIELLGL
ncbi:MAG TPA: chromosome partitioning protein ParB, partial [Geobacteraceae bacterium]